MDLSVRYALLECLSFLCFIAVEVRCRELCSARALFVCSYVCAQFGGPAAFAFVFSTNSSQTSAALDVCIFAATLRVREVPQTSAFLYGPHVFRYEHDAFMNDHHTFPFDPDTIHYDSGAVIYDPLAFRYDSDTFHTIRTHSDTVQTHSCTIISDGRRF